MASRAFRDGFTGKYLAHPRNPGDHLLCLAQQESGAFFIDTVDIVGHYLFHRSHGSALGQHLGGAAGGSWRSLFIRCRMVSAATSERAVK